MQYWKHILIGVAILAVAGAAYSSISRGVSVEAAKVSRGDIREYVDEEAKTRLADTYLMTMPYNGRISAIDLVEGSPVTKGQSIAQIVPLDSDLNVAGAQAAVDRLKASIRENDDSSVETTGLQQTLSFVESMNRTVEAAAARVKSGEAKLNYAERNLARTRKLNSQNPKAKSDDELEQAQVSQVESSVNYQQDVLVHRAVEAIRAATALMPTAVRQYIQRKNLSHDVLAKQLAEAEVALQQAERDAERGRMVSPVDGVVLERAVSNEGQLPAGTLLLRIGRWEDLEVEADVLSQEVVNVKPGQSVDLSGPAIGTPVAHGKVERVYPAGFTKVSSLGVEQQRVKVIVKFLPDDLQRLRSERDLGVDYRVMVRIFTAEKSNALLVPRSAVFRGPTGDWRLYAIRSGRAKLQSVKLGLSNDEQAEIISGVEAGELVILAPETNLVDGQSVSPHGIDSE